MFNLFSLILPVASGVGEMRLRQRWSLLRLVVSVTLLVTAAATVSERVRKKKRFGFWCDISHGMSEIVRQRCGFWSDISLGISERVRKRCRFRSDISFGVSERVMKRCRF